MKRMAGILASAGMLLASNVAQAEVNLLFGKEKGHTSKIFAVEGVGKFLTCGRVGLSAGAITMGNLESSPIAFVEGSIGVGIEIPYFYARVMQGVGVVSKKARGLETYYQLPTTISLGFRQGRMHLGFMYKHFSNGSDSLYNSGKNFYVADFGMSF